MWEKQNFYQESESVEFDKFQSYFIIPSWLHQNTAHKSVKTDILIQTWCSILGCLYYQKGKFSFLWERASRASNFPFIFINGHWKGIYELQNRLRDLQVHQLYPKCVLKTVCRQQSNWFKYALTVMELVVSNLPVGYLTSNFIKHEEANRISSRTNYTQEESSTDLYDLHNTNQF